VLRYFFLFSTLLSFNLIADIFLSSPKIKVNDQNQRIIEFRIEKETIRDGDIVINEYKTKDPINDTFIEYTLINDFGNFQTFSIVLANEYQEDYFSFNIAIKESFSKDIFIFLPSKARSSNVITNTQMPTKQTESIKANIKNNDNENIKESKSKNKTVEIFKSGDITTVWSMAETIKGNNKNISIYQVMWSIYLGNRDAFIDNNINLIRKDIDILIPSFAEIEKISYQIARDSIFEMNNSFADRLKSASKSLLVLTAPKVIKDVAENQDTNPKIENKKQIDFSDSIDPKSLIEQNTKEIRLAVDNQMLDDLTAVPGEVTQQNQDQFEIFDLIFISLISLASGILLALIFIQVRKMRPSKEINYDFDEAEDDDSSLSSLPSDLSIKNDEDQQQLDLAVTYFEMNDKDNAKSLLENLVQTTSNDEIKKSAKNLLDKVEKL
jgi:FimV-like protein